jgi:hypothetical protein
VICILATQGSDVCTALVDSQHCIFPPDILPAKKNHKNRNGIYPGRKIRGLTAENFDDLRDYATPQELTELSTFKEFVERFVKPSTVCSVQCMLLWAEWVRYYKKTTREFPALILEKNFRDLVKQMFDVPVSEDDTRGFIFPGIKFVP